MRTFETLTKGISIEPGQAKVLAVGAANVKRDYLILFGPRTGSTWLTTLLSGHAGWPDEYINPEFLARNAQHFGAADTSSFMQAMRGSTNWNSVFGIEATCEHIEIFGEKDFFDAFSELTVFHLWRENLVAQAVSIFKAVMTGHYHSNEGSAPPDPEYDAKELANWFRYMARIENGNVDLIMRQNLGAIHLTYETLYKSVDATRDLFFRVLDVSGEHLITQEKTTQKIANDWNTTTEARFRIDAKTVIDDVEANRLVHKLALSSSL